MSLPSVCPLPQKKLNRERDLSVEKRDTTRPTPAIEASRGEWLLSARGLSPGQPPSAKCPHAGVSRSCHPLGSPQEGPTGQPCPAGPRTCHHQQHPL